MARKASQPVKRAEVKCYKLKKLKDID